jgi:hypothetical protein
MSEQYLNKPGLGYFWAKLKDCFAIGMTNVEVESAIIETDAAYYPEELALDSHLLLTAGGKSITMPSGKSLKWINV